MSYMKDLLKWSCHSYGSHRFSRLFTIYYKVVPKIINRVLDHEAAGQVDSFRVQQGHSIYQIKHFRFV